MKRKPGPKVSKSKERTASPFPEPSPSYWPYPWEPVDLYCGKLALKFGNTGVLARYLREAKEVDASLFESLSVRSQSS